MGSAHDLEGPPPDTEIDAMEAQWQQAKAESVNMGTQQDLEIIFPELELEEMEAFERALKLMGYKDDGQWSVGLKFFDPLNRPWGTHLMMTSQGQEQLEHT